MYRSLLSMVLGLEQCLVTASSDQEIWMIADCVSKIPAHLWNVLIFNSGWQLHKGAASAWSDDTKSLKRTILDWIVPCGEPLIPPIAHNIKADRGFNHEKMGFLMCPAELDWSQVTPATIAYAAAQVSAALHCVLATAFLNFC